ncbi:MAG: 23S rRNA (guanosine(2251)-2'-O)-methyltransferase RlmB [Bacilli bacterium]|nr:23S rRNA (guanosine(2251)-2'-O)-methyltransferase RlmB [Bacilli bacterium]
MIVYGKNVSLELLQKNKKIKKIFLQENFRDEKILSLIEKLKIPVLVCSKKKMDHLSDGVHQGIILDIQDYQYKDLDSLLLKNPNFIVILDHLEDPHNLGAIIRTCEAAGVDMIIIPKDRQVQVNATVMKTSAGALSNMNIVRVANLASTISKLKREGFWIVGTNMQGQPYDEIDYNFKVALVIGNEGKGMSDLISKSCDFIATIPMVGKINSLNASVSAGVMIYEVVRNRK